MTELLLFLYLFLWVGSAWLVSCCGGAKYESPRPMRLRPEINHESNIPHPLLFPMIVWKSAQTNAPKWGPQIVRQ